ncbi:MAG: methyltransferase domain-containing protein [Nitrospirae bacterium]|nr:methyltransferase domain-containing protein [Nitrospirota bacterium]
MDLKELEVFSGKRHPYETARYRILLSILSPYIKGEDNLKVLDVGSGDGYISKEMLKCNPGIIITCVDVYLTDEIILQQPQLDGRLRFYKNYEDIADIRYDIILMLDVLEHEKNDKELLAMMVNEHMKKNGMLLLKVPAFQFLFGDYDILYKHYRRYRLGEVVDLAKNCNLKIIASGYLFFSLLILRFISSIAHRLLSPGKKQQFKRLGTWNKGWFITSLIETLLVYENKFILFLSRNNIKLPGLSAWVLCEKL